MATSPSSEEEATKTELKDSTGPASPKNFAVSEAVKIPSALAEHKKRVEDRSVPPEPQIQRGRWQKRVFDLPERHSGDSVSGPTVYPFAKAAEIERGVGPWGRKSAAILESPVDYAAIESVRQRESGSFALPLPDFDEQTVEVVEWIERGPHTTTLRGKVASYDESDVFLVYNDGTLSGSVSLYEEEENFGAGSFQIQDTGEGRVQVQRLHPFALMEDHCDICGGVHDMAAMEVGDDVFHAEPLAEGEGPGPQPQGDPAAIEAIDLAVGYCAQSRSNAGGVAAIEARIIESVDRINLTFLNSGLTNHEAVLLGMMEDPDYDFSDGQSFTQTNTSLGLGTGELAAVHNFSVNLGADLRAFIVPQPRGGVAGVANVNGRNSVTALSFMSSSRKVFVHEVGHNFGLRHAVGDLGNNFVDTIQHGWRFQNPDTDSRRRTIMALDWGWPNVPHFSNPDIDYWPGVATGAAPGTDVTGDPTVDPRFVSRGFDGSNPDLGADAAGFLRDNLHLSVNRASRTAAGVLGITAGDTYFLNFPLPLQWTGGVAGQPVDLALFQDGAEVKVLAEGLVAYDRLFDWVPDSTIPPGDDYAIRLNLDGQEVFSDTFSLITAVARVTAQNSPLPGIVQFDGVSEVTVTFNDAMDPSSFSLTESITSFTGPGGSDERSRLTGHSWNGAATELTVSFQPITDSGYYRLQIGPDILNAQGVSMDQNENFVPGEGLSDAYVAHFRVSDGRATEAEVIFEDLMGEATELTHGGWDFGKQWEFGLPGMTPPDGPDEAFSGPNGKIIATNLTGTMGKNNSILDSPEFDTSYITEGYYQSIDAEFQNWRTFSSGTPRFFSVSGNQVLDDSDLPNTSGWQKEIVDITDALVGEAIGQLTFSIFAFIVDDGGPGWNLDEIQVLGHGGPMAAPAPVAWLATPESSSAGVPEAVSVAFSSPMKQEAFEAGDLFSFAGPEGEVVLGDVTWVHESLLRMEVAQWSGFGSYTLTLNPGFRDVTGQQMDQNQNGVGGEIPEDRMAFPLEFSLFAEPLPDTAYRGRLFRHELIATEEVSAWSAPDLPAWLEFRGDATGGTLVGIPPASGQENESFTLTATTEHGAANAPITLNLNETPPAGWPEVSQSATAGFEGETASVSATVSGDGPFTLRVLYDDGDKGLFSEDWNDQIVVSVDDPGAVTEDIPFLVAGQTYTFRIQVENSLGTAIGEAVSFTMPGATPLENWLAEFGYTEAELDTETVTKGDREVTLREAYLLGDDPNDPNDIIQITELATQPDGETLRLHFPSLEGRVYELQHTDDLTSGIWSEAGDELPGNNQPRHFDVPLPAGTGDPQQFYRIRVSFLE